MEPGRKQVKSVQHLDAQKPTSDWRCGEHVSGMMYIVCVSEVWCICGVCTLSLCAVPYVLATCSFSKIPAKSDFMEKGFIWGDTVGHGRAAWWQDQ